MRHGQVNDRLAALGQRFVILAQAPVAAEPSEGPFGDPSLGQDHEAAQIVAPLDDLENPAAQLSCPVDQVSGVPSVGPDPLEPGELTHQFGRHELGPIAILDVGRMHDHGQQQAQGIYDDVTLAPVDFLARVVAPRPPFSAVLTDPPAGGSMIAADGLGFRPSWIRTFRRRAS